MLIFLTLGNFEAHVRLIVVMGIPALLLVVVSATTSAATFSLATEKPAAEGTMLVDCDTDFACKAAQCFVPKLQPNSGAKIVIRVPNPDAKSLFITEPWFSISGSATGRPIALGTHSFQGSGLYVDVPIAIHDRPAPDDYKGSVIIATADPKGISVVPVNVQVRASPIWVIIVIFVSLGLGAFAQFADAKIKPRYALTTRLDGVAKALHQRDLTLLQPAIDEALQASDRGDVDEATVLAAVVASHAHILCVVRGIESALNPNSPGTAAIHKAIDRVRRDIRYGLDPSGDMVTLTSAVGDNTPEVMMPEIQASVAAHLNTLASLHAQTTHFRVTHTRAGVRRSAFAVVLSFAKVIVVIVLAWTGFYLLWIKNPSFGGNWLVDYATAVIWGLGTKAVLSSIPAIQAFLSR